MSPIPYVAPSTRSTAEFITAAIWNQDIVDNENAAFPLGVDAWTAFTPTWTNFTLGNGTLNAKYQRIGRTIFFYFYVTLGTTSSMSGDLQFTLPVAAAGGFPFAVPIGRAGIQDTGTANFLGLVWVQDATHGRIFVETATGTYVGPTSFSSTVPMTWASTDAFNCAGFYEAAT